MGVRPGGTALAVSAVKREYTQGEERPLGSCTVLMGAYGAVLGGLTLLVSRQGGRVTTRLGGTDLALVAVATRKLSRLLAKDPVTSPLRAPFTRFQGRSGDAELQEEVRGTGARKALDELITCPFCPGQWVATGFVYGMVLAPGVTRPVAAVFTALTAADFLQFAYAAAQEQAG